MFAPGPRSGLTPRFAAPPPALPDRVEPDLDITEEAGIVAGLGPAPRVELLAEEDAHVARGAPVARLRDAPEICLVAPMAARIGRVSLLRGTACPRLSCLRTRVATPCATIRPAHGPKRDFAA